MTDLCIHCKADIKTCGCPDECEMSDCHNDISSPHPRFQCRFCHTHYCGECRRIYLTVANGVVYESEYCANPDCNEWINSDRPPNQQFSAIRLMRATLPRSIMQWREGPWRGFAMWMSAMRTAKQIRRMRHD